jgi:WS/DGAT/MGAT family acyltransferase
MARKPFSNVDTAWLRMEDPTNLMMITGVMVFGAPLDFERLKVTVQHRLLPFDRFRQRVSQPSYPGGNFYWEEDAEFDLDYHLQRATLPPPGDQAALQDAASRLASTQLDLTRPLWQLHLIDHYGDGCALICRLHHCIGDGLALVHVLLSLTDTDPNAPWPDAPPEKTQRPAQRPCRLMARRARSALRKTSHVARTVVHQGAETLIHPSRIVDLARVGTSGTTAFGKLVLRWPDPKTIFKGALGVPKRAAWSVPIPLQDVKAVGQSLEGTVNDVLLTAVTGGLRRYLQGRGEPTDDLSFRAFIPVNLRQPGTEFELGNKFGLVYLSLPVGIADPTERLRELKQRMDGLKGSLEAPVAFGILNAMGLSPSRIQDLVLDLFQTKGTAVMTNVVGPKKRLYLAGAPLDALMFWVPQSGRLGLGVSILSYADQVWIGVISDEGLVPDPETIIDGFHAEFDELLATVKRTPEAPKVQQMAAMLDDALAKLDAMLEEAKAPATTPAKAPVRCQGLTKAGNRCRNRPLSGSDFCRVHQPT